VTARPAEAVVELSRRLYDELHHYADAVMPRRWVTDACRAYFHDGPQDPGELTLLPAWLVFHARQFKKPLCDWFLEDRSQWLTDRELRWLKAQRNVPLSVWRVDRVDRTKGLLAIEDVLQRQPRLLKDPELAETVRQGQHFLGRVVELDDECFVDGVHPLIAPEEAGTSVVKALKRSLGARGRMVDAWCLQREEGTLDALRLWRLEARTALESLEPTSAGPRVQLH
jgi:hypothetical protein